MIHLDALELRLSHERDYLRKAKTANERALRTIWIAQIEKEILQERAFTGRDSVCTADMTDDQLLTELGA